MFVGGGEEEELSKVQVRDRLRSCCTRHCSSASRNPSGRGLSGLEMARFGNSSGGLSLFQYVPSRHHRFHVLTVRALTTGEISGDDTD